MTNIDAFLNLITSAPHSESVFNPWTDYSSALDIGPEAPAIRLANLRAYLQHRLTSARLLFVAEAPGYQGARFSGIAMTCERTLLGYKRQISPDLVYPASFAKHRSSLASGCKEKTQADFGYVEKTATVVWNELVRRPISASAVVLWNVFPFHPHASDRHLTNRGPSDDEVARYFAITQAMIRLFPQARIVAIGETAKKHLRNLCVA